MITKEQRAALAAPFEDELVKWKPGSATFSHKPECRGRDCRETHDATKHMQFAYVEDESVMDRLDEVFGLGGWSFKVDVMGEAVVRGSLIVHTASAEGDTTHQDFGYGSGTEPLKEASTDAFRRCGRMVGIARYIYAGELEQAHRPTAPRPAAPERAGGTPRPPAAPFPDEDDGWDGILATAAPAAHDEAVCPVHGGAWRLVPAGTSKSTGRPYDAFWTCDERGCKAKPSHDWIARAAA